MARRPQRNRECLLTRTVTFRVTAREYEQLAACCRDSDCPSIGEAIRRRLAGKAVRIYYRDTTRDSILEELASIRRELTLLGISLRQYTQQDDSVNPSGARDSITASYQEYCRQVNAKVSLVLSLIAQLARKW